jgi:hypothetical protein
MKCLSISQPWAWAILAGHLDTDYRCYPTDYRGDLLLHAARGGGSWERDQLAAFGDGVPAWADLPFGQVVGVVELWACERGAEGEWAWRLRNPRLLAEPFPSHAGRRLFDVTGRRTRRKPRRP